MAAAAQEIAAGVRAAFEAIDTDRSGGIDAAELKALLQSLQPQRFFADHDVEAAIKEMGGAADVQLPAFARWWEGGGKLTASERLELRWKGMQDRFQSVMDKALGQAIASGAGDMMTPCAVTQRPAKYVDPLTELSYADAAALKELRARLAKGEIELPEWKKQKLPAPLPAPLPATKAAPAKALEAAAFAGSALQLGWLEALDESVFSLQVGDAHERTASLSRASLYSRLPAEEKRALVGRVIAECPRSPLAKAIGAMVGLAAADATGHWFEFLPACDRPGENRGGSRFDVSRLEAVPGSQERERPMPQAPGGRPACFEGEVFNKFALQMGQWTDDCSMALAMADSLIVRREFDGSDIRTRFWNWWHRGYGNAFGRDDSCGPRTSVGLGGNIAASIDSMEQGQTPTARYESSGEDSGNGSIMRLAPIAIFFSTPLEQPGRHPLQACMDAARESSYTTHPGAVAAECCAFLAYLVARAIQDPRLPIVPGQEDGLSARAWLEAEAAEYSATVLGDRTGAGVDEVRRLLASAEPEGSLERSWNWRATAEEGLQIEATLRARGHRYNGFPVSAGYFGSYAPDGLAVALHSVASTSSADAALERCINFLGDADSTGAVAGQLAGAIWGVSGLNEAFVQNLQQWDDGEIAVRAALLLAANRGMDKD